MTKSKHHDDTAKLIRENRIFIRTDMIRGLHHAKAPFEQIKQLVDMFDKETDKLIAEHFNE